MSSHEYNQEDEKFSLDDLIKMADEIRAKHAADHPQDVVLTPFNLLCAMSARVLAAYIPERSEALLSGQCSQVEQTFAMEMLGLNQLPASLWISEERQKELYGGMEPMLFQKLPRGLFLHYAKLLGRDPRDDDPMSWDATEVG